MRRSLSSLAIAAVIASPVAAQPTDAACQRAAGAPAWLPCGPDRVLGAADLKQSIFKDGTLVKMLVKGGSSGRLFFTNYHPDGRLEAGLKDGTNIGKGWTLEGDKVCRTYYQVYRGPQCATFELKEGVLFLIDADNSRNPVLEVSFVPG